MRASLLLLLLPACGAKPTPTPPPPVCSASLGAGAGLDLGLVGDGGCPGSVTLTLRVATGTADAPTWSDAATAPLTIGGSWTLVDGVAAQRSVSVTNPGAAPVALVGLEWSTPPGGLDLPADRLLNNGYQSWSYSGVLRIPSTLKDIAGTAGHGGDNEDLTGERRGVSWWWTWVGDATGRGLIAGATSAAVLKTYFAVDGPKARRLRIIQGLTGDVLTVAPGATVTLDGLWLELGGAADFGAYANAVATGAGATRSTPLGGWGSWNLYYAAPKAPLLRDEASWAAANLAPLGLKDFLLDDGYEPRWGDWQASTEFGAPLATLNAEQAAVGLVPAVWLAPIYVDLTDPLVTAHPDWFVHRANGTLRTYVNFGPSYAALDVSHPEARAHVTTSLQRLWSWGYRTFKLDFLFGAAIEGVRQEPLTGLQSYQRWMDVIRAAVPGANLVGCGAPLLPSVGRFESMRTGTDIAFSVSPEPQFPFLASQARQTATRGFTDRWWALDPDVVLLRGTGLTDAEAWTSVVAELMAGGTYLLGDARQASPLRRAMALAPELVALTRSRHAARALDFAAQTEADVVASPLIVVLQGGETKAPHQLFRAPHAAGEKNVLAIFGWDADYETSWDFPAGASEWVAPTDPSAPLEHRAMSGSQTVAVPKHGARLFVW